MAPDIGLPGAGMPANEMSTQTWYNGQRFRFPYAITDWEPEPITLRERDMLEFMNQITDKPEWRRKVFDEEIVSKWGKEVDNMWGFDNMAEPGNTEETEDANDGGNRAFSQKMFDWCIAELRHKAKLHVDTGVITVLDFEATIVKADTIASKDLQDTLKKAVAPLENVPDRFKDWHPGSDGKVLDLVHPSLFPLVYGRSRVVTDGTVGVEDCTSWCGKGEVIPVPSEDDVFSTRVKWSYRDATTDMFWSKQFQWLPCNVEFADKDSDAVKIVSYVNNLHPIYHKQLYPVLEQLIAKAVPLWNECLTNLDNAFDYLRIQCECTEYWDPDPAFKDRERQEGDPTSDSNDENYDEDEFWEFEERWVQDHRTLVLPEPEEFKPREANAPTNLKEQFGDKGFQVIVKLANIHLTPEKPTYDGGSWHVEGMLNDHICATALYYYDNENITDSRLHFRQKTATESVLYKQYAQNDFSGVEEIYGIEDQQAAIQEIGAVLTREGRMLAFPNVLQHRVAPFELADKTKPGHRKIVALFLVDPYTRVLSTANVPPQQRDWWAKVVMEGEGPIAKLPLELQEKVVGNVEEFPIGMEEAKELREKLMKERMVFVESVNDHMQRETYFFCEH